MATTTSVEAARPSRSASRYALKVFLSNSLSVTGAIIVLVFILVGVLGSTFAPYESGAVNYQRVLEAPSRDHLFGTDAFGRDVFSRVLTGAGISLRVGLTVIVITTALGMVFGILSGYLGGTVDTLFMRVVDLFMAFPPVVIALVLAVIMGRGLITVMVALCLSGWTGMARLARGEVLSLKNRGFVRASRVIGAGRWHIIWHHLLPNILPPVLISASLSFGRVVLNTAGLSFIGVGVQPPLPEWGTMINEGRAFIVSGQWWLVLFPGLAILTSVMGLNLLGDGVRDILDPRERK